VDNRFCESALSLAARAQAAAGFDCDLPPTLAGGTLGLAVMAVCCEKANPGAGWGQAGHRWLVQSARAMSADAVVPAALFSGLAGLGMVAIELGGERSGYSRLLANVDDALAAATLSFEDRCRHAAHLGLDADVISGAAGILRYWLARAPLQVADDHCRRLVAAMVDVARRNGGVLDVRFPSPYFDEQGRVEARSGASCLGTAHGTPGTVAAASLALLHDVDVPDLAWAVSCTVDWLIGCSRLAGDGMVWPMWSHNDGVDDPDGNGTKDTWCYGNLGVSRALAIAASALRRDDVALVAAEALRGACLRLRAGWQSLGWGLCHGKASVVAVLARSCTDTFQPIVAETLTDLASDLAARVKHDGVPEEIGSPSLLEGTAGVSLALMSAGGFPEWDRILLLS
jgi:lantibiotic biosynthesis protein